MLKHALKFFSPGGFFASYDVIDPGDVFGDFGVDSWLPCSSTAITPTNNTIEKACFATVACQWPAGVSLYTHIRIKFVISFTICDTATDNEVTKYFK